MDLSFTNYVSTRSMKRLKELCRTLDLSQCGSRPELQKRVLAYATAVGYDGTELLDGALPGRKGESGEKRFECVCVEEEVDGREAVVECGRCSRLQHQLCVKGCLSLDPYECPRCQLEQMDPFYPLYEFLSPPFKVPFLGTSTVSEFLLTPSSLASLHSQGENYTLQLRCLRLDAKGYTHAWPYETLAMVNEVKVVDVVGGRKRKTGFVDLTVEMGKERQRVGVWKRKDDGEYVYAVVLTKKRAFPSLFQACLHSTLSLQASKSFILSLFHSTPSLHLQRLPLHCPLTYLPIDIPVRGWRCQHLQCFDLTSYLLLMEHTKVRRWQCPLCKQPCCVLLVDTYMQRIVNQAKSLFECDMVDIREDGGYQLIETIKDGVSTPKPQKMQKIQETVLIDHGKALTWTDFQRKIPLYMVYESMVYQGVALRRKAEKKQREKEKITEKVRKLGSFLTPIDID